MTITFPCWNCGKSLKAKEIHSGRKCPCSGCKSINTIPGKKVHDPTIENQIKENDESDIDQEEEPEEEQNQNEANSSSDLDEPIQLSNHLKTHNQRSGVNWLIVIGSLLLMIGIGMLIYYLLIFDPTVPEFPSLPPELSNKRIYNIGLMNHKIVGSIASGILSLVGTILVVAGAFRKDNRSHV